MARYREALPQLADELWFTDSGLETDLIFHGGFELPEFAAFPLLAEPAGRAALSRYFREHAAVAFEHAAGFVYEAPTWRASTGWGAELGYGPDELAAVNRDAIGLGLALRAELAGDGPPVVVSGCVGPRGDGYRPSSSMTAAEAQAYHQSQIDVFAGTEADLVCAMTLTYADEAIGIARAADRAGIPVAISFTLETDGRLPDGTALADAVRATDDAVRVPPAYYLINCAHPEHIEPALASGPTGPAGCVGCEPTRRAAATPSSTSDPISTRATRASWPASMPGCG